jgi:hypothetical protein
VGESADFIGTIGAVLQWFHRPNLFSRMGSSERGRERHGDRSDCLPLKAYMALLEKVAALSSEFTTIIPAHHEPIDAAYLVEWIACGKVHLGLEHCR